MKLEPKQTVTDDPIKHLPRVERLCYYAAVTAAFISVFVWAVKILFL